MHGSAETDHPPIPRTVHKPSPFLCLHSRHHWRLISIFNVSRKTRVCCRCLGTTTTTTSRLTRVAKARGNNNDNVFRPNWPGNNNNNKWSENRNRKHNNAFDSIRIYTHFILDTERYGENVLVFLNDLLCDCTRTFIHAPGSSDLYGSSIF